MQGQLARPAISTWSAVDALLADAFPVPVGARPLRVLGALYLLAQAGMMLAVRVLDGEKAFLEGASARGLGVVLLLGVLPLAMGVARARGVLVEDGVVGLAALRGVPEEAVRGRGVYAALRVLARVLVPALIALVLWPLFLGIDDAPTTLLPRVSVVLLLAALTVGAALVLLGLGVWLGRRLPARGAPWALLALVVVPWVAVRVGHLPPMLSLPGLYRSLADGLLTLAPTF